MFSFLQQEIENKVFVLMANESATLQECKVALENFQIHIDNMIKKHEEEQPASVEKKDE